MKQRTILHVDCNSFFCSVSLHYKPHLKKYPVAVGGDAESRHGIILAKNDHAKKYGVKTAMALWQAKQVCPNLVIIPPDYDLYSRFSKEIKEGIFSDYTNLQEPFGSDESWLDVTGSESIFGNGMEIAEAIRRRVKKEMGITVSIGVSWNKIFAKLGSDMKKPDAITEITPENYKEKVWSLPVEELLYVGPATTRKLHNKYVMTIGDLANYGEQYLVDMFGKTGYMLHSFANGLDNSPVSIDSAEPYIKSVGNSSVIAHDVTDPEEVKRWMYILADSVGPRMRQHGFAARTVEIMVCDNDMGYTTRQKGMPIPTNLNTDLASAAWGLFQNTYRWQKPIRKIGIRGSNLVFDTDPFQCSFERSADKQEKREELEKSIDSLNERWTHCVQRAVTMIDQTQTEWQIKEAQRRFTPIGWF